jgi:hypothetical protein
LKRDNTWGLSSAFLKILPGIGMNYELRITNYGFVIFLIP